MFIIILKETSASAGDCHPDSTLIHSDTFVPLFWIYCVHASISELFASISELFFCMNTYRSSEATDVKKKEELIRKGVDMCKDALEKHPDNCYLHKYMAITLGRFPKWFL